MLSRQKIFLIYALLIFFCQCSGPKLSIYVSQADKLVQAKEYRKAVILYQKMIQDFPNEVIPYYNQAALFRKLKEYERAYSDYQVIYKLNPDLPYANYGFGELYFDQERYPEAEKNFNKVLDEKIFKSTPLIHDNAKLYLSRILLKENKPADAIQNLTELIGNKPPVVEAYYFRAQGYDAQGDKAKAKADFEEYVKQNGAHKEDAEAWIKTSADAGKFDF